MKCKTLYVISLLTLMTTMGPKAFLGSIWHFNVTSISRNLQTDRFKFWEAKYLVKSTVWPQPIWIKVRTSWQIPLQHQSIYLGGPESASIEIPPFRPFLWSKFSKIKNFKNFRIAPKIFFALKYIKTEQKLFLGKTFFVPEIYFF